MMSKAWWAGALASVALALAACHPHYGTGVGQIGVGAQFPTAAFRTQVIPAMTTSIDVTISGEGLTAALSLKLTPTAPKTVVTVPAGPKTVSVTARDAAGKTVARATSSVTVIGGQKTTAILDLVPEPEPEPTPSPEPSMQPSPGPSPTDPASSDPTTVPSVQPSANSGSSSTPSPSPTPSPTPSAIGDPNPTNSSGPPAYLNVIDGSPAPAPVAQDF